MALVPAGRAHAIDAVHGAPDVPVVVDASLKQGFVLLKVLPAAGAEAIALQLPKSTTVGRLRQVLRAKRLLSAGAPAALRLSYYDSDPAAAVDLDDDLRDLAYYGVQAGFLAFVEP